MNFLRKSIDKYIFKVYYIIKIKRKEGRDEHENEENIVSSLQYSVCNWDIYRNLFTPSDDSGSNETFTERN